MHAWVGALALVWWSLVAVGQAAGGDLLAVGSIERQVTPILQLRCLECHSAKTAEGGLDLTRLSPDLTDAAALATWIKVHDRVRDGEMPPKDAERLTVGEKAALLKALDENLHSADAHRQSREGRALARRLNRDEYQNTLRDLLGIADDYRSLVPDDGSGYGFDKVGSALSVSPEHLEAYLAAADAALTEAIVTGPPPSVMKRMIPQRFNRFMNESFRRRWAYAFIDAPDSLVRLTGMFDPVVGFRAQSTGVYRFRVRAYAWKSERPVHARIRAGYGGDNAGGARWLVGYEDFSPEGTTVEVVVRLHPGDTLRVAPYGIGDRESRRKDSSGQADPNSRALAVEWVEAEGPIHDTWPPIGHQRLFGKIDFNTATRDDAERVLRGFLPRAFRRPVSDDEVRHYLAIYDRGEVGGFRAGIEVALKAVLCSPHFLFLHAPAGPLDDYALASRLSYFLWNSPPDDDLLAIAAQGNLHKPEVLRQQVERMLADPKSAAFTESFTGQWLDLRKITATSPDVRLYPEFDELLEYSMVQETRLFFNEMLKNDLSVANFVQSDFAMLNDRLARLYGMDGVEGVALRKVKLPPGSVRGGVLTQASVLKVTANGTTTSPVVRGAWVMDRLLNRPPPPPPPNIAAIEPDTRGTSTIREQLARHRNDQSCALCHAKIDPPGFALESFDVIGGWRGQYRAELETAAERMPVFAPEKRREIPVGLGLPVDASGKLPDGREFHDFADFRRLLLADPDQLPRALAAKLLIYATGSGPRYADRAAIDQIVNHVRAKNYGFRTLVHEVVQSPVFLQQ